MTDHKRAEEIAKRNVDSVNWCHDNSHPDDILLAQAYLELVHENKCLKEYENARYVNQCYLDKLDEENSRLREAVSSAKKVMEDVIMITSGVTGGLPQEWLKRYAELVKEKKTP